MGHVLWTRSQAHKNIIYQFKQHIRRLNSQIYSLFEILFIALKLLHDNLVQEGCGFSGTKIEENKQVSN